MAVSAGNAGASGTPRGGSFPGRNDVGGGIKAMYRLFILEDDADQAELLEQMVRSHARGCEFATECLSSIEELEGRLADGGEPDILLTDIMLNSDTEPSVDYIQRRFPSGCGTQIIYVTAFMEYCVRVYRTEHVYFLTKPVEREDLFDALDKALANLRALAGRAIAVRTGGSIVALEPRSILYAESDRRKLRIHTHLRVLETYMPLSELADKLPASFIQPHKSFLVNMAHISEMKRNDILLTNGELIPMSQKRGKGMREAFLSYLGETD